MTGSSGVIALMGATGAGKSSFINSVVGKDVAPVGGGLESVTLEVGQYTYVTKNGRDVRLVDTPGFNDFAYDHSKTDLEILQMIGTFLKKEYESAHKLSGIIYLHNINDSKAYQMYRRQMAVFKKLCGANSMKNVVVVTTCWDQPSDLQACVKRERELQTEEGLLKELFDGGAQFVRSGHFPQGKRPGGKEFPHPQQIVEYLLSLDPVFLQMQTEMGAGSSVGNTAAAETLIQEFEQLKRDYRSTIEGLNSELQEIKSATDEDRSHRDELRKESARLKDQLLAYEEHSRDMLVQWEADRIQIATKDELKAWQNTNRKDIEDLQRQLVDMKSQRVTMENHNAQLTVMLQEVRKERDTLIVHNQRSADQLQQAWTSLLSQGERTRAVEAERDRLQVEIMQLKANLHQAQADARTTQMSLQWEVEDLHAELDQAQDERDALLAAVEESMKEGLRPGGGQSSSDSVVAIHQTGPAKDPSMRRRLAGYLHESRVRVRQVVEEKKQRARVRVRPILDELESSGRVPAFVLPYLQEVRLSETSGGRFHS